MRWTAPTTDIAMCPIPTALEERRESAVGYERTFVKLRHYPRITSPMRRNCHDDPAPNGAVPRIGTARRRQLELLLLRHFLGLLGRAVAAAARSLDDEGIALAHLDLGDAGGRDAAAVGALDPVAPKACGSPCRGRRIVVMLGCCLLPLGRALTGEPRAAPTRSG